MPRPGRRIRGRKRERAEEDRVGAGGDRVARRRGSSMPLDQKGAGQDPGHSSRLARACRLDDGACDQRPEFAASTVPTRAPHLKRANVDHGPTPARSPVSPAGRRRGRRQAHGAGRTGASGTPARPGVGATSFGRPAWEAAHAPAAPTPSASPRPPGADRGRKRPSRPLRLATSLVPDVNVDERAKQRDIAISI